MIDLQLSPKEEQLIKELDDRRETARKGSLVITLTWAINQWQKFIEEIKGGYTLTVYDYTNDLSDRDIIEEYLAELSEPLRGKILTIVMPLDEQFRGLTNETDKVLMSQSAVAYSDMPWWYHRIPKKLVGELKEDINN
jgi:hypothetical protein